MHWKIGSHNDKGRSLLSGGIDSTLVLYLARKFQGKGKAIE